MASLRGMPDGRGSASRKPFDAGPSSRSWGQPCSWPAASPTIPGLSHDQVGEIQDPCIETHDQGCVPETEFVAMADAIASTLSETSSFENQWGLGAIRADQAYANLELQHGPDVAPGEGVLVGVLDTGIDAAHFQFRNKNIIQRFLPGSTGDDGTEFSHGTAVASLIAGEDDPDWPLRRARRCLGR